MKQPDKVANPSRGQLNRKNVFSPCSRSRLGNWSRETGLAVPVRVSPLILHSRAESNWLVLTHGISPAFRDGVHICKKHLDASPKKQTRHQKDQKEAPSYSIRRGKLDDDQGQRADSAKGSPDPAKADDNM